MRHIAILIFPGVQALDVAGPLDVFAEANRFLPNGEGYALTVLGTQDGDIACSNGLPMQAHRHYAAQDEQFDLLLVPGGPGVPWLSPDPGLCDWLRTIDQKTWRYGSVCNGAFFLGHAGLLDGRAVATHWNDAEMLARMFPTAKVDADRLYLRDGPLYSSAGVSAGIDLSLFLLHEDHGPDLALNVARRLVVYTQRSGGQSQFSPYLTPLAEDGSPTRVAQDYVRSNLSADLTVPQLAASVGMSERNFTRVFSAENRITPAEFVERARLDAARALLEEGHVPLKVIAFRCGFGGPGRMRQAFLRHLGVSPKQYQKNFGSPRPP